MAEIFDASGMGEGSGAQALADALNALASPLDDIAKNTRITADNSKQDLRSNPTLEDFFNPGASSEPAWPRMGGQPGSANRGQAGAKSPLGANAMAALADSGKTKMDMGALADAAASRRGTVTSARPQSAIQMATPIANELATVTGTVIGPTAAKLSSALAAVGTVAAPLAATFVAVTGAGIAAAAALGVVVATARHFTQAFDPSSVLVFDAAMKDLNAVVGSMMVPIVGEATRVIRLFSSTLYASTATVLPAMRNMAKAFGDVFAGLMPIVGQVTTLFANMFVVAADWARTIADFLLPQIRALATVVTGWGVALKSVLSSLFPTLGGTFKNALVQAAQIVGKMGVVFSALTFKLLGMTDALDAMMGSLKDGADAAARRDASGLAAAQNARMMAVSGLGNEILQRAFTTSGRAGMTQEELEDKQYRDDLMKLVGNIKDFNLKDLPRMIGEAVADAIANAPARAIQNVNQPVEDAVQGAIRGAIRGVTFGLI